jgi:hypothetical protein
MEYDTVGIFTLVKEAGELKVLEWKDFSDPEKRNSLHTWVAKAPARGTDVAWIYTLHMCRDKLPDPRANITCARVPWITRKERSSGLSGFFVAPEAASS